MAPIIHAARKSAPPVEALELSRLQAEVEELRQKTKEEFTVLGGEVYVLYTTGKQDAILEYIKSHVAKLETRREELEAKKRHLEDLAARYEAQSISMKALIVQDFVEVIRQAEPGGLDAVFDGMAGDHLDRGFSLRRRGGTRVQYGNPLSFSGLLLLLTKFILFNVLPNGKALKLYGTTSSQFGRRPFPEDWATLFKLLEEGKIKPIIYKKFPILEAAQANALLENGQVIGNVVLLAPELLQVVHPNDWPPNKRRDSALLGQNGTEIWSPRMWEFWQVLMFVPPTVATIAVFISLVSHVPTAIWLTLIVRRLLQLERSEKKTLPQQS